MNKQNQKQKQQHLASMAMVRASLKSAKPENPSGNPASIFGFAEIHQRIAQKIFKI